MSPNLSSTCVIRAVVSEQMSGQFKTDQHDLALDDIVVEFQRFTILSDDGQIGEVIRSSLIALGFKRTPRRHNHGRERHDDRQPPSSHLSLHETARRRMSLDILRRIASVIVC